MDHLLLSTYVKLGIICVGIAVGYSREDYLTATNRLFWIFLLVSGAGEVLDIIMARLLHNNYPYYHVFRPLYYALLTVALSGEMGKWRKKIFWSIPLVWVCAFLNALYLQPPAQSLNSLVIILISVLLILQVLFYIAMLFENFSWKETVYRYSFWIAMGIMLSSISSILSLGIYNRIGESGQKVLIPVLIISEWLFYGTFILNFMLQKSESEL